MCPNIKLWMRLTRSPSVWSCSAGCSLLQVIIVILPVTEWRDNVQASQCYRWSLSSWLNFSSTGQPTTFNNWNINCIITIIIIWKMNYSFISLSLRVKESLNKYTSWYWLIILFIFCLTLQFNSEELEFTCGLWRFNRVNSSPFLRGTNFEELLMEVRNCNLCENITSYCPSELSAENFPSRLMRRHKE